MSKQAVLAGHWPLAGDAADVSGNGNNGIAHDVTFSAEDGGCAVFDGRSAWIEVPGSASLQTGRGDFSIAVRVHTDRDADDLIGDIASRFDPTIRRGFNLSIMDYPGIVYGHPNCRNLFFGIDNAITEQEWTDCGRPGNALHVFALGVHEGDLYAGTFEGGTGETGHVWRYQGGTEWEDCGSPDGSNTVMSFAVLHGDLCCSTGRYRASGSALDDAGNQEAGGNIFRYRGGREWEFCGRLPERSEAHSLTVFGGTLYAIPSYERGVYRYDGGETWTCIGEPGGQRCMTLCAYDGHLYSLGNEYAGVWRYDGGTDWTFCGTQAGDSTDDDGNPLPESQIYGFASYEGKMHVGSWPTASVYRYEGGEEWFNCGRLGEEREVMGMAVYNGKLYCGTLPLAQVYRYDGPGNWTLTGRLDWTPDVTYRRAWSMAVYDGRLYCGTLPSGKVYALEAGRSATWDRQFPSGWNHVAAVRNGDRLILFVNGEEVAASRPCAAERYDLDVSGPLRIGLGQNEHFCGRMKDFRMYTGVLRDEEVRSLACRD